MRIVVLIIVVLLLIIAGQSSTMMRGLSYGIGRETAHSMFHPHRRH